MPAALDSISEEAFYECVSLESQRIPDNVSFIGENAYAGCTNMEEFTFGKGLKETDRCFGNKELSLKKVISLNTTPPYVESWATFVFCLFNAPLYVPAGCVESYRAANGWNEFYYIYELSPDDSQIKEVRTETSSDSYRLEGRKLIANKQLSLTIWTLSGQRIMSANLNENESVDLPGGILVISCDNNFSKISSGHF